MSIAAGYAEAHGFDYIILGGNLEESSGYADNELIFQRKFNNILPNALNLQNKVEVLSPVANLMKHEIIKLGLEIGAPLHLTWSCYEDGDKPCGECGPDFMRRVGFKMNKVKDMQSYKKQNELYWDDCKDVTLNNGKWE
jgi:7-cyano-7-deazaguanine synthase